MADHMAMREYLRRLFVWEADRGDKFETREDAEQFFDEWLAKEKSESWEKGYVAGVADPTPFWTANPYQAQKFDNTKTGKES